MEVETKSAYDTYSNFGFDYAERCYASDNNYGYVSGASSGTRYVGFEISSFNIPEDVNIDSITIGVEYKAGSASGITSFKIIAYNLTTAVGDVYFKNSDFSTSDAIIEHSAVGVWSIADLNAGKFRVYIERTGPVTLYIDHVYVSVVYSVPVSSTNYRRKSRRLLQSSF